MRPNLSLLALFFVEIVCIWPVPYEIHLSDSETFVISDDSNELYDDEDEMIQPAEIKQLAENDNNEKYFKIHQMVLQHNKRELSTRKSRIRMREIRKIPEQNFDLDDPIPWQGGFVDKDGNFIHPDNEKVYYFNEMAKSLINAKIDEKREENESPDIEHYDYNEFKHEYQIEINREEKEKNALRLKDAKEKENLNDAVDAVTNFNRTNCTAEEKQGIGYAALKCLMYDVKKSHTKNALVALIEKMAKIILIWLCVYVLIAVPCWCSRGWCCCCCPCRWCRPREVIDESKRFFMQNPVGAYRNEKGQMTTYTPTYYEKYAQKRLEKALFNL